MSKSDVVQSAVVSCSDPREGFDVREFFEVLDKRGYVILPKEPSEKMIEAALHAHATNASYESPFGPNGSFADQYRAMLKAYEESER